MKGRLFTVNTTGQLCNRLFAFAHLIAWAKEHDFGVVNLSFFDQRSHFEGSDPGWWPAWPPGRWKATQIPKVRGIVLRFRAWFTDQILRMLAHGRAARWLQNQGGLIARPMDAYLDMESEEFMHSSRRHRVLVLNAWQARCDSLLHRHSETIRSYFVPLQACRERVASVLETARAQTDVLVGVHLRAGDYRTWMEGRYYFNPQQYDRWLDQMRDCLAPLKVSFLLASNEPLPEELKRRSDIVPAPGEALSDLHCLAGCDYLLGPPSTFTGWASFWGQVPLFPLRGSEASVTLADFKPFSSIEELYTLCPVPRDLPNDCR